MQLLIFDLIVELNCYRLNKQKTEYFLTLNLIKDINDDYKSIYNDFLLDKSQLLSYNKVLRSL